MYAGDNIFFLAGGKYTIINLSHRGGASACRLDLKEKKELLLHIWTVT
jgi:hypothetical protein